MATHQPAPQLVSVAQQFHQGAFHEVRATLSTLKRDAAMGRLDRRKQALLLELAEYGLFYTSFYERILQRIAEQQQSE